MRIRSLHGDSAPVIAKERQWIAVKFPEILMLGLICVELLQQNRACIDREDCQQRKGEAKCDS